MNGIACTRGPPGTAGSGLSTHSYHVNILHPTLEFLELSITMTAWEKSWEIKNPRLGEIRNSHSCGPGSNLETFRQLLLEFLLCRFFLLQLQNLPQLLDTSIAQSCPNLCTLGTAARQVSLSNTNSRSLLKLMSIESVMPSNHLILCHTLLFLPSIFPSIRIFSNDTLILHIRCPKYWFHLQHQSFQWIFRTDFL